MSRRTTFFVALAVEGVLLGAWIGRAQQPVQAEQAYITEITKFRQEREHQLRTSPFSTFARVHVELLRDRPRLTIGSGPGADLRLPGEGIAPLQAVIEGATNAPTLKALGGTLIETLDNRPRRRELSLQHEMGFRIGRYNLRYMVYSALGRTLWVYDPEQSSLREFRGLEYFPVDPAYPVPADVIPYPKREPIALINSQGSKEPWYLYGELRFELQGTPCRLELYTESLDPKEIEQSGFMLMFTDATSGKESYPTARYLYVEGKTVRRITVDFNKSFNASCNYAPVTPCPLPRQQNRLSVPIRAGEKWYRGNQAQPLSLRVK